MKEFTNDLIITIFALITAFIIIGMFYNFTFSTWSIELKIITLLMVYLLRFESRIKELINNKK